MASGVAELLEEKLSDFLENIETDEKIRYCIGDEDILSTSQSCSMMVSAYSVRGYRGVIGILGPMRMDYAYNTVALDLIGELLRSY